MIRVAVYARVSTSKSTQELSLESQMAGFACMIEDDPEMILAEVYADDGITGTSARKRTRFLQMIEDAHEHRFDTVMTRSISRFARNTVECLSYVRELSGLGINVIFQKEGIDTASVISEMLLTVLAAFAQEESRSISENLKWSIPESIEYYFLQDRVKRITFARGSDITAFRVQGKDRSYGSGYEAEESDGFGSSAIKPGNNYEWVVMVEWIGGEVTSAPLYTGGRKSDDPIHAAKLYERFLQASATGQE